MSKAHTKRGGSGGRSAPGPMTFRGWREEAIEFFEGLEADNSKTYWQRNRAIYDEHVRAPMELLLAELRKEFGEGKVFRPYRDIRFSKDKSPYKTNIAATLEKGGYISLSTQGLGAGSGMYMMAADQLERFRRAVDDDRSGKQLEGILGRLTAAGMDVGAHDELKTAPKGYPKDHPRIDILRRKGLICWQQWPVGAWLGTSKAKVRVIEFLRAAKPLNAWLAKNVGTSSLSER